MTLEKEKQADLTSAALAAAAKQAQQTEKNLAAIRRQTKEQERQAKARRESLLLGVGFPLLFGGGAGSVLGSAAGAFSDTDGGFGGQIFGGAIGQAIDNFAQSAADLGKALNPLTGDVEKVAEAAGISGTKLEKLIKELEAAGEESKALEIATAQLADVVGNEGVTALRKFGEQTQDFTNILIQEATRLKAFLAGAFTLPDDLAEQAKRGDLLNQARQSQNPRIKTAVRDLDFAKTQSGLGVSPDDIVAAEEKLLALIKEVNAEREKRSKACSNNFRSSGA